MTNKERREATVEVVVTCKCGEPSGTLYKKYTKDGKKVYRHFRCNA